MNIAPLPPISSAAAPNGVRPSSDPAAISSQDFLTLLVAHSKNQDALSPTDSGDVLLQLASLAQVSGLQDIKATLERLFADKSTSFDAAR